jgi:hypothetical protein
MVEELSTRIDRSKSFVFWLGAGCSHDCGMPLGRELTTAWLTHLLPSGEPKKILNLCDRFAKVTDYYGPRLEKVIDDAISIFGTDCLSLLNFFHDCEPTDLHKSIGNYSRLNQTFVITTNFDTAIEFSNPQDPLPVLTPQGTETIDWGVLKIHGGIQEGIDNLGASIRKLQSGLTQVTTNLLDRLISDPQNVFVFLGYSAGDFFDVNPYFERKRLVGRSAASAIWIHHDGSLPGVQIYPHEDDWGDILSMEAERLLAAFQRSDLYCGRTHEIVELLLAQSITRAIQKTRTWNRNWEDYFYPTEKEKRQYAAKMYASLGIGPEVLAHRSLSDLPRDRFNFEHQSFFNALRDAGCYEAECLLRRWANKYPSKYYPASFHRRQYAAALRLSGRWLRACIAYIAILRDIENSDSDDNYSITTEDLWSVAEAGIFAQSTAMPFLRGPILRLLFAPFLLWLRSLSVRACKILYSNLDDSGYLEPHLVGNTARIEDFITSSIVPIVRYKDLDFLSLNKFPLDGFGQYLETDSMLGSINYSRFSAHMMIQEIGWTFFPNKLRSEHIDAGVFHLKESLGGARVIGDYPGQIKALFLLAYLNGIRKQRRLRSGRRRLAKKLRKELAHQERTRVFEARQWLAG